MCRILSIILLITLCMPAQAEVIFFDGFERATVDQSEPGQGDNYPWHSTHGSSTPQANVRTGERCLQGSNSHSRYFDISGTDRQNWWWDIPDMWVSFYVLIDSNAVEGHSLFDTLASSAMGLPKLQVWWASNNRLEVRDQNDILIATGTTELSLNTWYRIDVKCGTGLNADYELRIHEDGSPGTSVELSGKFNQRISNIAMVFFNKLVPQDPDYVFIDDVVFSDSGYFANGSDYRVESIFPNEDGSYTDWAGNWTDIDDKAHDDITTEISTNNYLDAQTAELGNIVLSSGESIEAVMIVAHMRKSVNNKVNVRIRDRVNITDRDSPKFELQDQSGLDSRGKWWVIYTIDPEENTFTESVINDYEIGVVHSQRQNRDAFCTAINANILILQP